MRAFFLERDRKAQKLSSEAEPDMIVNNLSEAIKVIKNWIASGDESLLSGSFSINSVKFLMQIRPFFMLYASLCDP